MSDTPKSHGRKSIKTSLAPRDLMEENRLAHAWTARSLHFFLNLFLGFWAKA